MDLSKALVDLRAELADLDAAILTLERLKEKGYGKRGRPPKVLTEIRRSARLASENARGKPAGSEG